MSTILLGEGEYGDLSVGFEYGKGWGGNDVKPYHCLLYLSYAEKEGGNEDDYMIVAMTPEDALRLSAELRIHAQAVHEGEMETFEEWSDSAKDDGTLDPDEFCDKVNDAMEKAEDEWDALQKKYSPSKESS